MGATIGQEAAAYAMNLFLSDELSWHNTVRSTDVDFSNAVAPLDALLVINELNNREFSNAENGQLQDTADPLAGGFLDVDDDGLVTPLDALLVINDLPTSGGSAALSLTAVPEPGRFGLFLPPLLLWVGVYRSASRSVKKRQAPSS